MSSMEAWLECDAGPVHGRIATMKSTIDAAGRIVIPRDIRAEAGLEAGTVVEIAIRDGIVSIEPAPTSVKIVKRGRLRIAVTGDAGKLSEKDVRAVREQIRGRS